MVCVDTKQQTQQKVSVRPTKGQQESESSRLLSRNVPFILGSLIMLLVVGLVGLFDAVSIDDSASGASVSYGLSQQRNIRPTVYQFDNVFKDAPASSSNATAAQPSTGPRKIPYIWQQVWESAGWIPQKLMVGKFSGRTEYQDILQLVAGRINEQQQRHILKYLAMHALGGGWVAHSDTFPLHDFRISDKLPNNGKLTTYDVKFPCLMSGSAQEWLRMGKRMAEHAKVFDPPEEWTEAIAMHQMQGEVSVKPEVFEVQNVAGQHGDVEWVWNSKDCHSTHEKRAVHFRLDSREEFESMDEPGDMVVKWLSMWLQACERSYYFIDQDLDERKANGDEKKNPFGFGTFHAQPTIDSKLTETMNKMQSQSNTQSYNVMPVKDPSSADIFDPHKMKPAAQEETTANVDVDTKDIIDVQQTAAAAAVKSPYMSIEGDRRRTQRLKGYILSAGPY